MHLKWPSYGGSGTTFEVIGTPPYDELLTVRTITPPRSMPDGRGVYPMQSVAAVLRRDVVEQLRDALTAWLEGDSA